jgi:hypothetical protein
MWNVKAKVMSVIKGATGKISKSLKQYLNKVTGKHDVQEPNKTTTLGTAHILREVLVYCTKGVSW